MDYAKLSSYRHADPLKVRQVWDAFGLLKSHRPAVPADKISKILRKSLSLKDDQIRLLLDEIEGDGLIEKIEPPFGKNGMARYQLPDFSKQHPRGKHDWYCFQCHRPGEVLRCLDCFRVYHSDCIQEASGPNSPSRKSMRSPTLHDGQEDNFTCPVCESRPKCEFSRKQIRKLLEFATHQLRKQPLWKTFIQVGYKGEITKNEYLVYKYTDLELLQRKIKDGRYAALEEFSMDVQLLVHDVCILHGPYSNQADEIRFFFRSVNAELNEIQLCTDCYINAKARVTDWISKPCKPRHELIWARNRTSAGAGLFNDTSVSQFYWPAKILLERDDGYEIRFFGGSHERMFVKKAHTRAFHLPADEVGVLRRSNATGAIPGGGFERAWNEVSKLQANIDSGYYTHSSGESDLPPSDDDYSDEMYLGPRRKIVSQIQRLHRGDSPRSSLNSGNTKGNKRRRHTSSSSHQTTASATPTGDSPTRDVSPHGHSGKHFRTHGFLLNSHTEPTDKRSTSSRLPMPAVQPGTPGAAAISALAETKAAMAAAVGSTRRPTGSLTADLLSLTHREHDKPYGKQPKENNSNAPIRGQRGRGRPPLRDNKGRSIQRRKYQSSSSSPHSSDSPSSSISSDSLSEEDVHLSVNNSSQNNWCSNSSGDWKVKKTEMPRRGRPPKSRGRVKAVNDTGRSSWCSPTGVSSDAEGTSDLWMKSGSSNIVKSHSTRGRSKLATSANNSFNRIEVANKKRLTTPSKSSIQDTANSGGKRPKRYSKQLDIYGNVRDEDDELTDRCDSPIGNNNQNLRHSNNYVWHPHHPSNTNNTSGTSVSPMRKSGINDSSLHRISPSKKQSSAKQRSSHSSNFSTCSSPSSSDMDDNEEDGRRQRNIVKVDDEDDDRRFRSPTRSVSSLKDRTSGASSTMLRRPPFAPPLNTPGSNSNSNATNDRNNLSSVTNLFPHAGQNLFSPCSESVATMSSSMNSNTSSANRLGSSTHPAAANSNLPSHFVSPGALSNNSNNVTTTPVMSTLPRSHLPPNKRAAAAATAAALNKDSVGGGGISDSSGETSQRQASIKSPEMSIASSPRKQVHKGIQTPASMEIPTSSQQPCSQCKEREAERLAAANETKKALRELEEKLIAQFKEEKSTAIHSALEQAQANAREAIEHERKLAHETLEAAEARFAEVIVQTKRRQWCRNCLMEAIYHCCWNTSYCSTQCQQEHWQKEHKRQCRRNMPNVGEIEGSKMCSSIVRKDPNLRKLLLEDTLDVAPAGLTFCFDRELFLNDDFNSDDFILEQHRRGISLEKLRDDLLQYSNILKSSLIELINQDYADFVSLSTNLVGLDKSIDTITTPLKQLQSYVSSVLEELQSTDEELSTKLKSLQHIKNEKDYANSLFTLDACVSRLERWLTQSNERLVNEKQVNGQLYYKSNNNNGETSKDINNDLDDDNEVNIWPAEFYADCSLHEDIGQRMDRIANEYIKLQFFAKKCRGHTILNSLKPRIHWITVNLQERLDARLKESLEACCLLTADTTNDDCPTIVISRSSIEQLRQVISIYLAIDKLSDLMLIYRKFVLRDKLSQIFTPRPELTHAGSDTTVASETLDSMYTRALKILDSQLYHVKEHILRSSSENSESLSDFDCLVNGFWPETIDLICDNLPEVFSPGHPDRFYSVREIPILFTCYYCVVLHFFDVKLEFVANLYYDLILSFNLYDEQPMKIEHK
ncbi:Zinc finger MYND domain-containing protein [Schistosoma japonicum]|uniref:Conserved oligomeric Golgi complex subunit 2 n=2 Tax=Schistosoma japonicum TaxID=6182 RepID=A0A4Z2DNS6_SCHJA|nr:Zinc finger MYND domain-containing protein [Schistosoma japonicum]